MTQQQQQEAARSRAMTRPLEGIPLPDLERLPDYERGFWEGTHSHELHTQRCSDCERLRHLPTPMCPSCHSVNYEWHKVSGRGRVYSYVIVHHPVHRAIGEREQTPYNVCLIELEEQEGLRIVSNVLNVAPEEMAIDMPVEVTFMPTADDANVVLPMFFPAQSAQ